MAADDLAVVAPFSPTRVSGYDYGAPMPAGGWNGNGQSYGWLKHLGSDYGTRAGEPIRALLPGKVTFEAGVAGYGNRLILTLSNGYKWIFGHVAAGASGFARAGETIGYTGENIGSARGSVTLVEVHDPQGRPVNPHTFLDPIFRGGATARSLYGAAAGQLFARQNGPSSQGSDASSPSPPSGDSLSGLNNALVGLANLVKSQNADLASGLGGLGRNIQNAADAANPVKSLIGLGRPFYFRIVFVGIGVLMIGAGLLIYFKGDELKQLPAQLKGAAEDAGEVAAPEAAPAIEAGKRISAGKSGARSAQNAAINRQLGKYEMAPA